MRAGGHVAFAVASLVAVILGCKHTYTPPGTASDASVDVAEELEPEPTGACEPKVGNTRCVAGGKAAFCKSRLVHDGPRMSHWAGDWATFTCPGCSKESEYSHIKCSDYAAGEACDSFVADEMCTRDKLGVYRCDPSTGVWTIEACPRGCSATYQLICKH